MARIAGVNIPQDKHIEISLTYVYGVGRRTSQNILRACGIDPQTKTRELDENTLDKIREHISREIVVE